MERVQQQKLVCHDERSARLQHALVLAAYIVIRHGDVYAPLVDRLERELSEVLRNDPASRARRVLESYAKPVKAPRVLAPR